MKRKTLCLCLLILLLTYCLYLSACQNGYLYEQGQRIEIALNYDLKLPHKARLIHRYEAFGAFMDANSGESLEIYDLKRVSIEQLTKQMDSNGWQPLPMTEQTPVPTASILTTTIRQMIDSPDDAINLVFPMPTDGYYYKESWNDGFKLGVLDCNQRMVYFYCYND